MLREFISLFIITTVLVGLLSGYAVHKKEQKECQERIEKSCEF